MNKRKKTFLGQLKLDFMLMIVIPVFCLGAFMFYISYQYIKSERIMECKNMIEQNQLSMSNLVNQCENSLKYLAANYSLQEFLQMEEDDYINVNQASKNVGALLYNTVLSNQYYHNVAVYTEKDFNILSGFLFLPEEVEQKSWYQKISNTSDIYWWYEDGEFYLGKKIVTSYPRKSIGIIVVELNQEKIEENFKSFQKIPSFIRISYDGSEIWNQDNHFEQEEFNSENMILDSGFTVQYQIDSSYFKQNVFIKLVLPLIAVLLALLASWICFHFLSRLLMKDMEILVDEVKEVQKGNLDMEIQESDTVEINALAVSIQSMLRRIQELIKQVYSNEIDRQKVELDLLQSKISPHFLYNNLSMINWLALDCGEEKISEIATELADFYRTALNKGNNYDKLAIEIANIKAYIRLQQLARENSFSVYYDIPESLLSSMVPIFILQPLVENAFEHGIDTLLDEEGSIFIKVYESETCLYMEVMDNGKTLFLKIGETSMPCELYGYGTNNVHKRVQLLYGESYGLQISASNIGTKAVIRLPLKK